MLWGTGWLAVRLGPGEPFAGSWEELIYKGPFADLVSFWQRWDALWYQHLAQSGYHAGDGSTAFFPLYPLWFSPLMSVGRYVLVVLPCFMVAGRVLAARPRLAIATLAVSGVIELVLLQYWARWGLVA